MRRPGPVRWIGYAFGAGLPDEYAPWVRHDTTAPTWILRHVARVLVVIALPELAILVWLPAGIGLRVLTAAVCGLCVILLTGILANDMTERRLFKTGQQWGTGERIRALRAEDAQRVANQRRRERSAARRARRA